MNRFRTQTSDTNLIGLSAKVPPELKQAVERIAEKEERSLSHVIVRLLRESPTLQRVLSEQSNEQSQEPALAA